MDTVAVLGVVFLLPEQVHIRRLLLAHRIRVLRIYAGVGSSFPSAYSRPYSSQSLFSLTEMPCVATVSSDAASSHSVCSC